MAPLSIVRVPEISAAMTLERKNALCPDGARLLDVSRYLSSGRLYDRAIYAIPEDYVGDNGALAQEISTLISASSIGFNAYPFNYYFQGVGSWNFSFQVNFKEL